MEYSHNGGAGRPQTVYKFPSNPWLTLKLHMLRVRLGNAAKATVGRLESLADVLRIHSVGNTEFGIQGLVNTTGFPLKLRRAIP